MHLKSLESTNRVWRIRTERINGAKRSIEPGPALEARLFIVSQTASEKRQVKSKSRRYSRESQEGAELLRRDDRCNMCHWIETQVAEVFRSNTRLCWGETRSTVTRTAL